MFSPHISGSERLSLEMIQFGEPFRVAANLEAGSGAEALLLQCVEQLRVTGSKDEHGINRVRERLLARASVAGVQAQRLRACISVFCDLRAQGWRFELSRSEIWLCHPVGAADSHELNRDRVRRGLLLERDQQLRSPAVRRFLAGMERQRLGPRGWVSIFSLMRDGSTLAGQLRAAAQLPVGGARETALREIVDPYLQEADDSICELTSLRLKDIWRYFRHTWSMPHKTTPGRNIWFLVRDRAAPNHPVVGIAALGSPVVQVRARDDWIGWSSKIFASRLENDADDGWALWLWDTLGELIEGIYVEDLVHEGVLSAEALASPDSETIDRLRAVSAEARGVHRLYPGAAQHKRELEDLNSVDWERRARTPLFRAKRAATLADLLEASFHLQRAGFTAPKGALLCTALESGQGRKAILRVLRGARGAGVGTDILDITVCGAVPPYSQILGGKLVALLMASPEVAAAYERRYKSRPSVIASSMAGRPVMRRPQLVLLTTTSLYSSRSSQYNRIRMPAARLGGASQQEVRFYELGRTRGFGSFHFSLDTIRELETLLAQEGDARRVNSIFGEGVSPRLRKVRDALDSVGLPSNALLQHGDFRLVYGVPLASNFREVLVGRDAKPKWIVPADLRARGTKMIVDYWVERWLLRRVESERILEGVEAHRLVHPIDHGARVPVPSFDDDLPLSPRLEG
jgi:hypothetical protein